MKKKFTLTLLGLVCALCCAFALVACGGNDNEVTGLLIAKSNEQPSGEEITVNITYGENPDLDYKFYLSYKNGETKEVDFSDENLTVIGYDYSESPGSIEKLPDEYLYGMYTIEYDYYTGKSNFRAYVIINVARARSGAFGIVAQERNWVSGEVVPEVTLKNPKGGAVQLKTSDQILQSNDSDGAYNFYLISKDAYVAFTDSQKTDYDFIEKYSDKQLCDPGYECYLSAGEYMLVATVEKTHNYSKVVTPAIAITIRNKA